MIPSTLQWKTGPEKLSRALKRQVLNSPNKGDSTSSSGQNSPMFNSPNIEEFYCYSQTEIPLKKLVPIGSCPVTMHPCEYPLYIK